METYRYTGRMRQQLLRMVFLLATGTMFLSQAEPIQAACYATWAECDAECAAYLDWCSADGRRVCEAAHGAGCVPRSLSARCVCILQGGQYCTDEKSCSHSGPNACDCPQVCGDIGASCDGPEDCCDQYCDGGGSCAPCPLLISLLNNTSNYNLTTAGDGVRFDMNGDGNPEQLAWTQPKSDVAFVVLDRNGNGIIDSGLELFGNETRMTNGTVASNGFQALADLDGNNDGEIDLNDAVYYQLLLWFDRDHDGVSDPDELVGLQNAGVTTIFLHYREGRRRDQSGNTYRFRGEALVTTSGQQVPRKVFDVYLKVAPR